MFWIQMFIQNELFLNSSSDVRSVTTIPIAHQSRNFENVDIDRVFELKISPYFLDFQGRL